MSVVFEIVTTRVFGYAIDAIQSSVSIQQLVKIAAIILSIKWIGSIAYAISQYLASFIAASYSADIRSLFYTTILQQPYNKLIKHNISDLAWRATGDINFISKAITDVIPYLIKTALTILIAFILIFIISPCMAIMLSVLLPLLITLLVILRKQVIQYWKQSQSQLMTLWKHLDDSILGMKTIRAYCLEKDRAAAFEEMIQIQGEAVKRQIRIDAFFNPLIFLSTGICFMVNSVYGITLVSKNQMTLGQYVQINGYMLQFMLPLTSIGHMIATFHRATMGYKRVNDIFLTKRECANSVCVESDFRLSMGKIVFSHVSLCYEGQEGSLLKDINIVIDGGQTVAMVGKSGCGKSSMIHLILRNYPINKGMIFIDDTPVTDYSLAYLRSKISFITQEPFLFCGTIKDNIRFSKDLASDREIRLAAEIAGLLDEIESFPDGFDTRIGERGVTLSGGQKQRLAIARAILQNPKILILDDALSSVDARTEELVLSRLRTSGKERTIILISKHIRSIKNVDTIYVLDNGMIGEHGTHDELIAYDGVYSKLCKTSDSIQHLRHDYHHSIQRNNYPAA